MENILEQENHSNLTDERVVILGGSSGQGLATAKLLADDGAKIIIASRSKEKVDKALVVLKGAKRSVTGEVVDANSRVEVQSFFQRIGKFDHLVLTLAGPEEAGEREFRKLDFGMLRRMFEGKFWPQLIAAQESLDFLRKDGSLTFITAVTAHAAYAGGTPAAAVNGALESIIPTLALELQPLRVNGVAPGMIDTPHWSDVPEAIRKNVFGQTAAITPVKRIGRPEDVAQVIKMLISDTFMTATIIDCDGGARIRSSW